MSYLYSFSDKLYPTWRWPQQQWPKHVVDKLHAPVNIVVLWLLYPYRIITWGFYPLILPQSARSFYQTSWKKGKILDYEASYLYGCIVNGFHIILFHRQKVFFGGGVVLIFRDGTLRCCVNCSRRRSMDLWNTEHEGDRFVRNVGCLLPRTQRHVRKDINFRLHFQ